MDVTHANVFVGGFVLRVAKPLNAMQVCSYKNRVMVGK